MRIKATAILAVLLLAITAQPALATVTFDPATGTGFVGKGDIQIPWGWNNAKLQSAAGSVTFSYVQTDVADYGVTCEWDTVNKIQTIHHAVTNTRSVNDTVAHDLASVTRKNPQGNVTGFKLTGFGALTVTSSGDAVPSVGDGCPNGGDGIVTAVDILSATSRGGLYATSSTAGTGPTLIWAPAIPAQ